MMVSAVSTAVRRDGTTVVQRVVSLGATSACSVLACTSLRDDVKCECPSHIFFHQPLPSTAGQTSSSIASATRGAKWQGFAQRPLRHCLTPTIAIRVRGQGVPVVCSFERHVSLFSRGVPVGPVLLKPPRQRLVRSASAAGKTSRR